MNDDDLDVSRLDLSGLPEPMRAALQNQLAKLPAPLRDKLMREGSPLLDRMIAKARERGGAGTSPLPPSAADSGPASRTGVSPAGKRDTRTSLSGERVPTVMPGDSGMSAWMVAFALVLIGVAWYAIQG